MNYTYTQPGQIATRTWARGVVTTYGYSSTTAELTGVTYSDSTPAVDLQYNRLGQLTVATETSSGGLVTTLDPCLCGKLMAEIPDATFFDNRRIDYQLHPTADGTKGRTMGYTLKVGATTEQTLAYGYDASGRFNSLTADGTAFTYAYTANSNLLASITQSGASWTQTRAYLSNRNLLDVVETKISTTSKAKFDYAHDNLGRFTSVAKTGEVFARYGNTTQGLDTTWGYDDRSQVTSEVTKLGGSATVLTGRDDAYAWDNIGNRSSTTGTTHNGNTASYTTNALNQYTARTVPGIFDVAGGAASGATVTVNGSSSGVTRHGEYFFKGQSMANNPNPVFSTLAVSDGTTTTNLPAFTAGTPEAMTYDDDGNLLTDGRWTRTYDAENRLIAMETTAAAYGTGVARQKLEFRPDVFGRRVGKKVYHYASGWVLDYERRFVYDGWNMIEELSVAGSTITKLRTYAWGLDLSGSRQGAGGVGGLLLVQEAGNAYLPAFDGNGNVHGLIKASDGSLAAAYEYDAFGNTLRESGPYAASNPFRFSTKYTDLETGLLYYGFRYYDPSTGRFLGRDPIGEQGGLNLHAFVGNNGVNRWDYLGMFCRVAGVEGNVGAETLIIECDDRPLELPPFVVGRGAPDPEDPNQYLPSNRGDFNVFDFDVTALLAWSAGNVASAGATSNNPATPQAPSEAPNRTEELNKCYDAARATHSADSARLGQTGEARMESFFGSIAAQRSAARAAFGEAAARTVRDSMIGVGVGSLVGAGASYQWARAAATGRSMYATARNWQQVSAIAAEVASYQRTANYVSLGFGTTAGVAYNVWNADDAAGAVSGSSGELSDAMLESRFGQAGVAIGITQDALEHMSNSGLSDQQVAGAVAGIRAEVNRTQQTLDSRLQSALSACDEKFK